MTTKLPRTSLQQLAGNDERARLARRLAESVSSNPDAIAAIILILTERRQIP